jgi:hypothetical protein
MNHADQSDMDDTLTAPSALHHFQRPAWLVTLVGLALAALGAFLGLEQFWRSYLLAFVFWLEVALGCLGMAMLHHLAGGRWSAHIRRLMETGAMTLPLMGLLFVPLLFALTTLYPWMSAEHILQSERLQQKELYLNTPFFLARAALYFAVWLGLAYFLNRWSLAQDRTGDPALATRMRRLSAVGLLLYVLTATFAAYDWLMSLEPEWFSSIYGLLFLAGQGLAALALAIIGLRFLSPAHPTGADRLPALNDLGNLLLGFVMIWAYFSFSQFLIIWSADIPEEAIWYYRRSQGGWLTIGVLLIAFHLALPFFLLLSRRIKRKPQWLTALAVLIFAARWLDLFWLIMPAFYPDELHLHWLDLVLLVAMGGGWIAVFLRLWTGKSPWPRHDPHLGDEYERRDAFAA